MGALGDLMCRRGATNRVMIKISILASLFSISIDAQCHIPAYPSGPFRVGPWVMRAQQQYTNPVVFGSPAGMTWSGTELSVFAPTRRVSHPCGGGYGYPSNLYNPRSYDVEYAGPPTGPLRLDVVVNSGSIGYTSTTFEVRVNGVILQNRITGAIGTVSRTLWCSVNCPNGLADVSMTLLETYVGYGAESGGFSVSIFQRPIEPDPIDYRVHLQDGGNGPVHDVSFDCPAGVSCAMLVGIQRGPRLPAPFVGGGTILVDLPAAIVVNSSQLFFSRYQGSPGAFPVTPTNQLAIQPIVVSSAGVFFGSIGLQMGPLPFRDPFRTFR